MRTALAVNTIISGIGATLDQTATRNHGVPVVTHPLYSEVRGDLLNVQIQSAFIKVGLVDAYFNDESMTLEMLEAFERDLAVKLYPSLIPKMHDTVETLRTLM